MINLDKHLDSVQKQWLQRSYLKHNINLGSYVTMQNFLMALDGLENHCAHILHLYS